MPLAFPSHQGLVLPVCAWFPGRFDAVASCVGAAMPDIVDAAAWPLRGELGQWLGHSLLGVVAACVPVGLAVDALVRRAVPRALLGWLEPRAARPALGCAALSVGVGALSHVAFDLVTHGNLLLFWPWYTDDHAFPAWWYHSFFGIPLPVYREPYPFAPHTIAWLALTVLGAWLFVRYLRRGQRKPPKNRHQPGASR